MSKQTKYAQLCLRCKSPYPPVRKIIANTPMWLHDGVIACKASVQREEKFQKDKEKEK